VADVIGLALFPSVAREYVSPRSSSAASIGCAVRQCPGRDGKSEIVEDEGELSASTDDHASDRFAHLPGAARAQLRLRNSGSLGDPGGNATES